VRGGGGVEGVWSLFQREGVGEELANQNLLISVEIPTNNPLKGTGMDAVDGSLMVG